MFLLLLVLVQKPNELFGDVSNDAHIELLSFDESVYESWPSLSLTEKLPYLLDLNLHNTLRQEYLDLLGDSRMDGITYATIAEKFADFHTVESIRQYYDNCDANKDETIEFLEYVVCRGFYDTYGNEHGINEYDYLDSIIIYDYEQKRNDPFIQQPMYEYDENGIIID